MNEQELKEMLSLLEKAGVNAELCDTPIPVSINSARCGMPTELCDECIDDYVLIPKALMGPHPEMYIPAIGDSMIEAGYEEGDLLRVRFGVEPRDGKDMLMLIDGASTVKTLFTDEDGVKWLVPQNDEYTAFPLSDDMDVRVLGMVVGVEKDSPHHSSNSCLKAIRKAKQRMKAVKRLSDEQVDVIICEMGNEVRHARQWYAVYRALVDHELTDKDDFDGLCKRVHRLLPDHDHKPTAKELSRMAVQSFAKPVVLWDRKDAPVQGVRYDDYLRIARLTDAKLTQ
jgi:SOS-response transcriptional repressor LexA